MIIKGIGGEMALRKLSVLFLAVCIALFAGCSQVPKSKPDDFTLYYYWNTGSLPPEYYYQYEIEIDPGGNGIFTLQRGYEEVEENRKAFSFVVPAQDWENFFVWLTENKILRNNWRETADILVGASTTEARIQVNGEKYTIPSVSVLSQRDKGTFYKLEGQIRRLVPNEIWNQVQ